jgi:hypothetical protein
VGARIPRAGSVECVIEARRAAAMGFRPAGCFGGGALAVRAIGALLRITGCRDRYGFRVGTRGGPDLDFAGRRLVDHGDHAGEHHLRGAA